MSFQQCYSFYEMNNTFSHFLIDSVCELCEVLQFGGNFVRIKRFFNLAHLIV